MKAAAAEGTCCHLQAGVVLHLTGFIGTERITHPYSQLFISKLATRHRLGSFELQPIPLVERVGTDASNGRYKKKTEFKISTKV